MLERWGILGRWFRHVFGGSRDILVREAASSPLGNFSAVPLNTMISVSNVSMRYGAKVLFDEVSTAFTPGKRYGLTGPNGAGKSTFMNLLTGELEPQKGTVVRPKKLGVLSLDQFAFDK
jgi:ABC-type bacteriocin/lantibiotic exporter with double-glycine peptidase domain